MINGIRVSEFLDTRLKKQNGKFPLKLRVFQKVPRMQKLYTLPYEFTQQEYDATNARKGNAAAKEIRITLNAIVEKAHKIATTMESFNFYEFEKELFSKTQSESKGLIELLDEITTTYQEKGSVSTGEKYGTTSKVLSGFLNHISFRRRLHFSDITPSFLQDFEKYCVEVKSNRMSTIGIHMRNIRAAYNIAVQRQLISQKAYPFGSDNTKYRIPSGDKVNKALTEKELKKLIRFEPLTESQAKAKDFWMFSYFSYGMNLKDICLLKPSSIQQDTFHYVRAKTATTKRKESIKTVPISTELREIIDRRRSESNEYLFDVLKPEMTAQQKFSRIRDFNKYVNKYFREFALKAGISKETAKDLGTYHARHTFATLAIRNGNSLALISEILHDGNLETTQNYLNTFPKESYVALSKTLSMK